MGTPSMFSIDFFLSFMEEIRVHASPPSHEFPECWAILWMRDYEQSPESEVHYHHWNTW
jgi:hypothetical protein